MTSGVQRPGDAASSTSIPNIDDWMSFSPGIDYGGSECYYPTLWSPPEFLPTTVMPTNMIYPYSTANATSRSSEMSHTPDGLSNTSKAKTMSQDNARGSNRADRPTRDRAASQAPSDRPSPSRESAACSASDDPDTPGETIPIRNLPEQEIAKKRREQNRIAQKAFRDRRSRHTRDLEVRLNAMKEQYTALERKYDKLRDSHMKLQEGVRVLLRSSDPV